MRPFNEKRVIIEYARVNRIVGPDTLLEELSAFGEDFAMVTDAGRREFTGDFRGKSWHLGNVQRLTVGNGPVTAIVGRFGWYDRVPSADVPPPYENGNWKDEVGQLPQGALAAFVVDAETQYMAITSLAGDVQVGGMCRAFTDFLTKAEESVGQGDARRALRQWLVEPKIERGSFRNWSNSVDRVTALTARFHLPNPDITPDIEPIVKVLNDVHATHGEVEVHGDSLDVDGHPIVQSAIAMEESDYGTLSAKGIRNGEEDPFTSSEHIAKDRHTPDPEDPPLSLRGVASVMLQRIKERVQRGLF